MIAKDLIEKIKNDRNGYVMIEVNSDSEDSFYVQGVKKDLLLRLKNQYEPNQETNLDLECGFLTKECEFID